ncbi:Eukaryotic translation initiation factor 3 subunit I [Nymphon striatum]|nr:Eukaryotic translation initiation factor 3 subunit I [Nymphon striatum]
MEYSGVSLYNMSSYHRTISREKLHVLLETWEEYTHREVFSTKHIKCTHFHSKVIPFSYQVSSTHIVAIGKEYRQTTKQRFRCSKEPEEHNYEWKRIQSLHHHRKPFILHGHERAITQIKYNREGDLLFSCAKDHTPNVWFSLNGERLGSFNGHSGAVWCMDVNWDSTKFASGSADNTCRIWDCETGSQLARIDTKTAVRTCNFSYGGQLLMYSVDTTMGHQCEICIVDVRTVDDAVDRRESKVTSALWGSLDKSFVTGHEKGEITKWDLRTVDQSNFTKEHKKSINDMQFNNDQTMFITASKDHTAKLFDLDTLEVMKVYKTERNVNSAAISPLRDHVVLGGGQEAMDVTTSSTKQGKFDAKFYHLVFEEEFARVKGHFGPINSVVFHPDGDGYSSGGEDGYVRVHHFDAQYFEFRPKKIDSLVKTQEKLMRTNEPTMRCFKKFLVSLGNKGHYSHFGV